MGISLSKGGRIDLSKAAPSLNNVGIGLGWDTNESDTGADFDLDASLFMINKNSKIPNEKFFVFYNNLSSPNGGVVHNGDNRTGEGDGDDESLSINLSLIESEIEELVFVVTIDEAEQRGQNFGQVSNAFIRIYDIENNQEIAKYDLEEDFSTEIAIEFGRLYKKSGSWRFKAVGTGFNSGLQGFVDKFFEN
ncbi:MAG: TerD family protein [Sulfurovum sp.]|nr:TerD family protein [Sulfurovaceae bacterium]